VQKNFVNKAAGIGAIVAVIIGIIIVSAIFSMDSTEDNDSASEEILIEESIPVEESEVVEETGEDFSVEFTESVGLETP
jgi:nitrogen fixation-related uncharacterized protein